MSDLEKFEEKNKKNLFTTIGSNVRGGLEELSHVVGINKKGNKKSLAPNQIGIDLDKFENKIIRSKKHN